MKKIGMLPTSGKERIVFYCDRKRKHNPFIVRLEWHTTTGKRTKTVAEYADFVSCMYHVSQMHQDSGYKLFTFE